LLKRRKTSPVTCSEQWQQCNAILDTTSLFVSTCVTHRSFEGYTDNPKGIANRNYCGFSKVIRTDILFSGHGLLSADSAEFLKITVKLILFRY